MLRQVKATLLRGPVRRAAAMMIEGSSIARELQRRLSEKQREIDYIRAATEGDIGAIEATLAEFPAERLGRFLAHRDDLPRTLFLLGPDAAQGKIGAALETAGFRTIRAEDAPATLPDGAGIVWIGRSFDAAGYDAAAALRERFPGRVFTAFGLLSGACLFWSLSRLVGFHTDHDKMLGWVTSGRNGLMPGLAELDRAFPLKGARVIEFGPLDGAMTAGLLHLGAAEVTTVDIRMVNALKVLSAAQMFGWPNRVRVVLEDMHMVDASTHGRYDLAVAHGVYYHSADPFRFLSNVTSLSDTVYLGGYCANPRRLPRPLAELEYGGHVYRVQPYDDPLASSGAGAHATGYYFVADDLLALMRRFGFESEILEMAETGAEKRAGYYMRALCRRVREG